MTSKNNDQAKISFTNARSRITLAAGLSKNSSGGPRLFDSGLLFDSGIYFDLWSSGSLDGVRAKVSFTKE